jgi:hypothetical protein
MTTTVAAIAKKAFDAVAAKIGGVTQTGTLTRKANATYNATTEAYTAAASTYTCRVVDNSGKRMGVAPGAFANYVAGPGEVLLYLEGLTVVPLKDDRIAYGAHSRTIQAVEDIVGAGCLYAVVAV